MLTARRSRAAVLVGTAVLLGAIAAPLPAAAAPGDDVLVFSNASVVDTGPGVDGGEYEWISAAITAGGYDVVPFDGGDGSALAWTTAMLAGERIEIDGDGLMLDVGDLPQDLQRGLRAPPAGGR